MDAAFDYLDYNYSDNRFKVFSGKYEWVWDNTSDDIFEAYICPQSWKGDDFHGTLCNGKWGIIDAQSNLILDYKYDWIEELSEEFYLLNVGGKLYSYYNGDDKRDELAIVGGQWNMSDKNGKILSKNFVSNVEELKSQYDIKIPKLFYARTDRKARKINILLQGKNGDSP